VPCNNDGVRRVRFTQSARKHRIGRAHALAAMEAAGEPEVVSAVEGLDPRLVWVGPDDRGVVLEVIGVDLPDYLLIIHVMPVALRRN
jgi:hypothetical protein